MIKNYKKWMPVKAQIHGSHKRPLFKEREVFWVSIGENVGHEQDGKGTRFNRPAVIVRKFSKTMCLCVPLSTTGKRGRYYFPVEMNGKTSVSLLSQIRVVDTMRFNEKLEMLGVQDFKNLKTKLAEVLLG